jgi:hypothetical protein
MLRWYLRMSSADSTMMKTLIAEVEDDGNKTQWQMLLHTVAAKDDATANLPRSALFDGRRRTSASPPVLTDLFFSTPVRTSAWSWTVRKLR